MNDQLKEDIDIDSNIEHWTEVELSKSRERCGSFKVDWESVLEMADRREAASKQVSPCPECGTIQVQLVDWSTDTLKMKCRNCKHKFERKLK